MNPFIYTIFYLALLILSYRVKLSWSLWCSLAISVFIILFEIKRVSYETFLLILFFNAIPFITEKFRRNFNAYKFQLRTELESVRKSYNDFVEIDKKQLESNLEIERKMQQVSSLYEVSKDMSACLTFEDIFNIFSSILKKSFRFRLVKLVLLKGSKDAIDSVYDIELGRSYAKVAPDNFDKELIEIMFETKKEILIARQEDSPFLRRLSVIKDFETLIAIPLISEEKIAGILYIENISRIYFENFLILAGQFAIELDRKSVV